MIDVPVTQNDVATLALRAEPMSAQDVVRLALERFGRSVRAVLELRRRRHGAHRHAHDASIRRRASSRSIRAGFRRRPTTSSMRRARSTARRSKCSSRRPTPCRRMVAEHGMNLFYHSVENRKLCCGVRKMEPLRRALSGLDAWITGLRREQSVTRTAVHKVEWDEGNALVKVNPLVEWTHDDVWTYIREHNVPYNALHDRGYPSIGCAPCTRAVQPGEHERAGRWWWEHPETKECGLHVQESKSPERVRERRQSHDVTVSHFREARGTAGPARRRGPGGRVQDRRTAVCGCVRDGCGAGRRRRRFRSSREEDKVRLASARVRAGRSRRHGAGRCGRAQRTSRAAIYARARSVAACSSIPSTITENCDFYYPAVVNRGDLQIAISTGGPQSGAGAAPPHRARAAVRARVRAIGSSSWARRGVSCSRPTWIPTVRKQRLHEMASLRPEGFGGQAGPGVRAGHGLPRRRRPRRSGAADAEGAAHPRTGRRRPARRPADAGDSRADSACRARRVRRQAARRAADDAAGNQSASVRLRRRPGRRSCG